MTIKLSDLLFPDWPHPSVLLEELEQPNKPKKGEWLTLMSQADKEELSDQLIDVVKTAYAGTAHGSFIKSLKDVVASDWVALDWDTDPELDVAVFWRKPRAGEPWAGNKIQGVGHDGQRQSKDMLMDKMRELLNQNGWWSESGAAVRKILLRGGVPVITDAGLIRALFPDSNIRMIEQFTYVRTLPNGQEITESVFGHPVVPGYKK